MSYPLPAGFVAGSDPARPNLVVCTLCGGQLPRYRQNIEEHAASAKHRAALSMQQQQRQQQQQAAQPAAATAAAAAAAAPSASSSLSSALHDSELELQLLAQKQKHAMQKLMMEQELEQIRLKQLLLEKKQRQEEADIEAKLAAIKLQKSHSNSHSGAAAAASSPHVATPPRVAPAAAAASSSLSLTPNTAPRVSAPIAPASAPAARPASSANASTAAPGARYSHPGEYPAVFVGVLTCWKNARFGEIEVPRDQAIDGQRVFPFHVEQRASGVDQSQLTVGSHVEWNLWVTAELRKYAIRVKPAGEEGQPAAASARPMEPSPSQQSDDEDSAEDDDDSEGSAEGEQPFIPVSYRKKSSKPLAAASSSASSVPPLTKSRNLSPGRYFERMFGTLTSAVDPRGIITLPAPQAINGTREVCVHESQIQEPIAVGSTVSFILFINPALKLFANEVRPTQATATPTASSASSSVPHSSASAVAGRSNGLWELETILREAMHRSSGARFVTSVVAQLLRQKFPYVADKLYPSAWLPLWQLADRVGLVQLETHHNEHGGQHYWLKPLFDKDSPMRFPQPTHAAQHSESALNGASSSYASPPPKVHGAGEAGAAVAFTPLATPARVVHKSSIPGGPASPDASPSYVSPAAAAPFAGPVGEFAAVRRALRSMNAQLGGDRFDVGSVALEISQRHSGFKANLGEGGWMALWRRVHAAGVAVLEITLGPTGDKVYHLRLAPEPAENELEAVRTALETLTAQYGSDIIDAGSVAQEIVKRHPRFKEKLGEGGWQALWKRVHAAGVALLEITLGPTGAKVYNLRRVQREQAEGQPAEFSELQSALASISTHMSGDSFDQASVAEWMGRRNPRLKTQLAGGGWMELWKRADAAGAVNLETRVGPAGATHYSLRLMRGPSHLTLSHSAAATTPHKVEAAAAAASSSSAQTSLAAASRPQASSSAVESAQAAEASDPSDDIEQSRLRRKQRLEDAIRREEELIRQEEEEMARKQPPLEADALAEAEARRVEQEQAEIEAAFAEMSGPAAAEPAQPALTQWTSLASSLSAHPIPSPAAGPHASASASSSSSSSSSSVPAGLLRGTFVEWLRGRTFGVVSYCGKQMLCHVDQIRCDVSDLTRGCAVQFVMHVGHGKPFADSVQPFGWSPTRGLLPGYSRGVISRWVNDTHGVILAHEPERQRSQIVFRLASCGAITKDQLPEHTKVSFKPFVHPNNGKTFANEVRPIKAATDKATHRDNEQTEGDEEGMR